MTKTFISRFAGAALSLSVLAAPVAVFADTGSTTPSSEIQIVKNQIKSLLDQVAALTKHLGELTHQNGGGDMASSTPNAMPCPVPTRNLGRGSHGKDVLELQKFLALDPTLLSEDSATGVFGPKTAEAIKRLQGRHGIATSTTGMVGPMTRDLLGKRCGEILGLGHMDDHGNHNGSTTPEQHKGGGDRHASTTPEQHGGQDSSEGGSH